MLLARQGLRSSSSIHHSKLKIKNRLACEPQIFRSNWVSSGTIGRAVWRGGAPLTHASALSGGSASVPGSFAFANPSTVPPAGTYTADVIFTPTDAATYATVPSTVNVTVRTRFEVWTNDEAISFSSDANGDGTADGLAWLLGAEAASLNARGLLPAPTGKNGALEIRFTMRNQTTRGSAVLKLQFGTTLDSWTNVMIPEETGSQGDVGFVITPEGDLNHVVVTIPSTAAGSKFARLSGTEN